VGGGEGDDGGCVGRGTSIGFIVGGGGSIEGSWGLCSGLAVGEEVVDGLFGRDGDEDGAGGGLVVVVACGVGAFDAVMPYSVFVAVGE
jgi:hypothetical protein